MDDKRSPAPDDRPAEGTDGADPTTVHPVEPAEGARDPGTVTEPERAEHPTEPAEGERQ